MFRQRKRCYDVTLSRQEGSTTRHLASAQSKDRLAGGDTGRLFLTFGGPVSPTGVSNCPLDRVLTYKNLIYLLNLQFCLIRNLPLLPDTPNHDLRQLRRVLQSVISKTAEDQVRQVQ